VTSALSVLDDTDIRKNPHLSSYWIQGHEPKTASKNTISQLT